MGLEPGRHESGVTRLETIPRAVRNIWKEEVEGKTKVHSKRGFCSLRTLFSVSFKGELHRTFFY